VSAGLPPGSLQFEVFGSDSRVLARLDLAWPSVKLAIEADGKAVHDAPTALYRDRRRSNDLQLLGWTVLRFTWADVTRHPEWVIAQVRKALEHAGMVVEGRR
jgi:very-short-patch-repair endonuclease